MMADSFDPKEFQARLQRLDALLQEVERWPNAAAQAHAREIVQAVLDLHGVGLERILDHVAAAGESAAAVLDACARDEIVAGLLLLHNLHPLELETRVRQALDEVRPRLHAHGGDVELLDVRDGIVRLRLEGNCNGCPSSAVTMRQTVEEAILGKAPDVAAIEVEGLMEKASPSAVGRPLVALPMV
ncbi:MAG TPA: NifU family protein [Gemmataceae bacterium]|jgi:Fe-S cluster biogenesis protein NfuA